MKKNSIFAILIISGIFSNCTKSVSPPVLEPKLSIHLEKKLLKIKDSTFIELKPAGVIDSVMRVDWSASMGVIRGEGIRATYNAPDQVGSSIIQGKVFYQSGKVFYVSCELLIYKQLIFLKADDLINDNSSVVSLRWMTFLNYIKTKRIKASLGLIGNSLESGNTLYCAYIKTVINSGYFEIWNHGYNHLLNSIDNEGQTVCEFYGTSYEFQKDHIVRTQNLAKEKLGITLHTFGAPGNAYNENTLKALEEVPDIKIWYFGLEDFSRLALRRLGEIEYIVGFPDFDRFMTNYDPEKLYLVLQIHPNNWDEKMFEEFNKIIEFLIQNNVTFINPYEYYTLISE
ncbi:MAG: DUF2334 domain-containing protein [bacterium]|nr:MAG: DUF2334 domain-containing protein [bacterium]